MTSNGINTAWAFHLVLLLAISANQPGLGDDHLLDAFDDVDSWQAAPSDGVTLSVNLDQQNAERCMRLEFDFHGHSGWASAVKPVALKLPQNYAFSFRLRGQGPVNKLEFKLVDESGENVWWYVQPEFHFAEAWATQRIKRRKLSLAWGPQADRALTEISKLEITVVAEEGGKGTIWVDDLILEELPLDRPYDLVPSVRASSTLPPPATT